MKKIIGLLAIAAMMVGMLAGPASANLTSDVGVYQGQATVGKNGTCNQDGTANVSGAGLGLPVIDGHKNAVYAFSGPVLGSATAGKVAGPPDGIGTINACGYLTEQLDKLGLGLGAACGASKGYGGQGKIDFHNGTPDISLSNIEWKISYGSFFILTADVQNHAKTKDIGELVSAIRAAPTNTQDCTTKTGNKNDGGMRTFGVVGAYAISPTQNTVDQNQDVVTCKDTADDNCLYSDKKN